MGILSSAIKYFVEVDLFNTLMIDESNWPKRTISGRLPTKHHEHSTFRQLHLILTVPLQDDVDLELI
jgi:hypothetical protein